METRKAKVNGVTKFYIRNETIKNNAIKMISSIECNDKSPEVVSIGKVKRSLMQNAMFHAICADIEKSGYVFCGKPRSAGQWKVILISGHAIANPDPDDKPAEVIAGIHGEIVSLRESSAQMKVSRMNDLITYSLAFCSDMGIPISEPTINQYTGGYDIG